MERVKEFVEQKGFGGSKRVIEKREGYIWFLLKEAYTFIFSSLMNECNLAELRTFNFR